MFHYDKINIKLICFLVQHELPSQNTVGWTYRKRDNKWN